VSNTIRYDSLLVRDLAAELHATLAGARLDAVFLDRQQLRVVLRTRAARRADLATLTLTWQLHPDAGHLTADAGNADNAGRVQLADPARISRIYTPPDERVIIFELQAAEPHAAGARRILIELITNQWNAVATGADDRIIAVLRERDGRDRQLRAGSVYVAPSASGRIGSATPPTRDEWHDALADVTAGERLKAVLRFAYMSPLNAAAVVGDADVTCDVAALDRAYDRYMDITALGNRQPVVIRRDGRAQPYSVAIDDTAEATLTLLHAFRIASAIEPDATRVNDDAVAVVAERIEHVQKRIARLAAEYEGAAQEAVQLRSVADILMANIHRVTRGAAEVHLEDFEGAPITITLDPSINVPGNAARMYDNARKRDRASHRIPHLIRKAGLEIASLDELAARIRMGTTSDDELEALKARRATPRGEKPTALPYRMYRTSTGLELRVGKGSRANDELTFRHSSPTDIWLHARDVAGAHVILRWSHAESNPPANDIAEAASLAALFSKARTSSLVPVDWTRRKYVRKPRKAPPGAVLPERVKTVFAHPDAELEERLRVEFVI